MATMELPLRNRVSAKGRVVIPSEIRAELGIEEGDVLFWTVKEGEACIITQRGALRRAQERVRRYVPEGVSLADELSAERREAAKNE